SPGSFSARAGQKGASPQVMPSSLRCEPGTLAGTALEAPRVLDHRLTAAGVRRRDYRYGRRITAELPLRKSPHQSLRIPGLLLRKCAVLPGPERRVCRALLAGRAGNHLHQRRKAPVSITRLAAVVGMQL